MNGENFERYKAPFARAATRHFRIGYFMTISPLLTRVNCARIALSVVLEIRENQIVSEMEH